MSPAAAARRTPVLLSAPVADRADSQSGPRIQFAAPVYDAGRLAGGEVVKHTYVFTNIGDGVLEISDVRASCGCTTTGNWSRRVEPGQTGSIPIQFNSGNFNGPVVKPITVTCNDPKQPTVILQVKATVWKPFEVTPQFAVLNVTSEAPSKSTTVRIRNNTGEPLTLSSPVSSNPAFAAELKTVEPGLAYELVVSTVPPLSGPNAAGTITVQTSSTNHPTVGVSVWASVQQAVMVMPALIHLPRVPLSSAMPYSISIRNNGTNALVLTEPSANAQGVEVKVKEIQPGRYFTLTASFPAGFTIDPDDEVELSVKSNHPKYPLIRVPVRLVKRPASVVAPAPSQVGERALPSASGSP